MSIDTIAGKQSKFNLLEGCATDSVHLDNSPITQQHNGGNMEQKQRGVKDKQSLDERIDSLIVTLVRPDVMLDQQRSEVRSLFKDVIQEVLPEKKEWGKLEDPYDNPDIQEGFNEAIDTINTKVKELLDANYLESIDA